MSDMKKKLDALKAMTGLGTGAELKRSVAKVPPTADRTDKTDFLNEVDSAVPPNRSYPSYPSDEPPPPTGKLADLLKAHGLKTGAALQREQGANPLPRRALPREERALPPSNVNRLRGLTDHLGISPHHEFESEYSRAPQITQEERDAGTYTLENHIPGEIIGDADGGFYLIRHDYPLDYRQGIVELGAALQSKSKHIAFSACDPELEDFDPRTACFVDTETTGLMGGTGTVAFLVGVGYFIEGAFRLDQCIMRDFDDEEPMLNYLAELFDRHDTLVSYNGKSFDLPLLRTRFIQSRIPFRGDGILHLDLVHAARRFWKQRLKDCSLGNVEREILSICRDGDVPGYLIPQLWFRYLEERDARPLEGVLHHHEMDILSLVSLTAWMSQCLDTPGGQGFAHLEDKLSVVRIHFRQKHYDDVIEHARLFLDETKNVALRRECLEMLALACKRRERWEEMQQAWEQVLDAFPGDPEASHELAKHHEHRTRDLGTAARLCREALTHYATREGTAGLERSEARTFRHRLERIEKKLGKYKGELEF